jgi:hypothetical protein
MSRVCRADERTPRYRYVICGRRLADRRNCVTGRPDHGSGIGRPSDPFGPEPAALDSARKCSVPRPVIRSEMKIFFTRIVI